MLTTYWLSFWWNTGSVQKGNWWVALNEIFSHASSLMINLSKFRNVNNREISFFFNKLFKACFEYKNTLKDFNRNVFIPVFYLETKRPKHFVWFFSSIIATSLPERYNPRKNIKVQAPNLTVYTIYISCTSIHQELNFSFKTNASSNSLFPNWGF